MSYREKLKTKLNEYSEPPPAEVIEKALAQKALLMDALDLTEDDIRCMNDTGLSIEIRLDDEGRRCVSLSIDRVLNPTRRGERFYFGYWLFSSVETWQERLEDIVSWADENCKGDSIKTYGHGSYTIEILDDAILQEVLDEIQDPKHFLSDEVLEEQDNARQALREEAVKKKYEENLKAKVQAILSEKKSSEVQELPPVKEKKGTIRQEPEPEPLPKGKVS